MKIQQNVNMQNNFIQEQTDTISVSKTHANSKNSITISGVNLTENSFITQRQDLAKRQAFKIVSDAFGGEKKLDMQMQEIKDEIKRLQDEINEKSADTRHNDAKLKDLQEEYGIDPDSDENKELSALAFKMRNPNIEVSDEELSKLSEYQQKALYYVTANQQNVLDIDDAKAKQMGNVQGYKDMKSERAKSQDMLKAQDAAEDILETTNSETITFLTKEAVDHVDEVQKEREEEAKEATEKKKEEKKEEAKKLEKEAIQQEMIENIKNISESERTSADIKKNTARHEKEEANRMEFSDVEKIVIFDAASINDTQNAVNSEITNILNRLSLLSNDIKGTSVDSQV